MATGGPSIHVVDAATSSKGPKVSAHGVAIGDWVSVHVGVLAHVCTNRFCGKFVVGMRAIVYQWTMSRMVCECLRACLCTGHVARLRSSSLLGRIISASGHCDIVDFGEVMFLAGDVDALRFIGVCSHTAVFLRPEDTEHVIQARGGLSNAPS